MKYSKPDGLIFKKDIYQIAQSPDAEAKRRNHPGKKYGFRGNYERTSQNTIG